MAKRTLSPDVPLTPRTLYTIAVEHGIADCRIRICDGMAVSYFPTLDCVAKCKDRFVIDVSMKEPVEFDELSADDMGIQYRIVSPRQKKDIEEWINAHRVKPEDDLQG